MKEKILFYVIFSVLIFVCFVLPIFAITNLSFGEETKTMSINKDKTYEQCEKEAFERLYERINKTLDKIVENSRQNEVDYIQNTADNTRKIMGTEIDFLKD